MRQSPVSPKTDPEAPRLLNQVRDKIRLKHYSIRTEQTYTDWVRRFILFHKKRHPVEMGAVEVEQFLTHLAVAGKVSASTQNQALNMDVLMSRRSWMTESDEKRFVVFVPGCSGH
jgi:predicted aldo/keto reductase-like oxidoreductase